MADPFVLINAVTEPGGQEIATFPDTDGVQHEKVLTEYMDDGTGQPVLVSATNPLPVAATIDTSTLATSANQATEIASLASIDGKLTSPITVTGTVTVDTSLIATSANQTNATQKTQVVDGSGNVIAATSNALDINIKSGSIANTTFAATQGTATNLKTQAENYQGGAAVASGNPLQVTGANGTFPISAASLPLPSGAATSAIQTDKSQFTKLTDGTDTALVTAAGEQNVIATAQPGVDIGDVTVNNGSGASAVNIQDGGNAITVDGTVAISAGSAVIGHVIADTGSTTAVTGTVTVAGGKTNNNAAPLATNIGALTAVANASAPTQTEGNLVALRTNLAGDVAITLDSEVVHAIIDSGTTVVTQGTASNLKVAATLDAETTKVIGTINVAAAQTIAVTQATASSLHTAATLDAETTKVIGTVRNLGNAGAITDGVNTAATAPANGILGLAIYNSTEPSPTTGQSVGIQSDAKGRARQVIMDAAGNTRGANVDANSNLGVVLPAETTKVIGTINIAAAQTVATVTTVSTVTNVATIGTSVTPGTGATNLGKAEDAQHTTGDVGVMSLGVGNEAQSAFAADGDYIPQATDTKGNNLVVGNLAHDAVDAGFPVKIGGQARQTNPTAVADADRVNFTADDLGRQVIVAGQVRDLMTDSTTTISASTSETTILTAVASTFLDVTALWVANTSATATRIDIRDTTAGSVRFSIYVPAGDTRGAVLSRPIKQATVNTNWTAQSSASVTDLRIYIQAEKNI